MKETAIFVYCVEDTREPLKTETLFNRRDFHQLMNSKNIILHYHCSTRIFDSREVIIRDGVVVVDRIIKADYSKRSFKFLCNRTLKYFPSQDYDHTLIMQSHCYINVLRTFTNKTDKDGRKTKIKHVFLTSDSLAHIVVAKFRKKLKAIIFDCCYMSTIENVKSMVVATDYMVACESSAPYFGFVSCARQLDKYIQMDPKRGLKQIVRDCVLWNNKDINISGLHHKWARSTDGSVLYLPAFHTFICNAENDKRVFDKKFQIDKCKIRDYCQIFKPTKKAMKDFILFSMITKRYKYNRFMKGVGITTTKTLTVC